MSATSNIRILCTTCGSTLTAPATAMGQTVECPECGASAIVSAFLAQMATPVASTSPLTNGPPVLAAKGSPKTKLSAQRALSSPFARFFQTLCLIAALAAFCAASIFGIIRGIEYAANTRLRLEAEQAAAH